SPDIRGGVTGGHLALELGRTGDIAKPRKQPDGHAHARRTASRRAASSAGLAVAPSIQTSPPSKNSCFQIGTICFTRSMTYRQTANASARCALAAAITLVGCA